MGHVRRSYAPRHPRRQNDYIGDGVFVTLVVTYDEVEFIFMGALLRLGMSKECQYSSQNAVLPPDPYALQDHLWPESFLQTARQWHDTPFLLDGVPAAAG